MKNPLGEKDIYTISDYQKYLHDLYGDLNQKRDFDDLYGYFVRKSGYLCKGILLTTPDRANFIPPFSWLCSLATKLEIDLQDAFLRKYPGICPNCLQSQCVCYRTNKMPPEPIPAYKMSEVLFANYEAIRKAEIFTLDQAVNNITGIFIENQMLWGLDKGAWRQRHVAKINEEMAELHEAHSGYRKGEKPINSVADKVADIFAWIVGAWGILFPNYSLDQAFIAYYVDACPVCRSFPCTCDIYDSQPTGLVDYKKLAVVKEKLVELRKILPDYQEDMSELIRSFDYALETHNEPAAKVVVSQTQATIEKIGETISAVDAIDIILPHKMPKQYDIFLSYATDDKDEARQISTFLAKKKLKVFISEKDIQPDFKWENQIRDALKNSGLVCILATPNSLKSEWVISEWAVAWANDIHILPILLRCSVSDLPNRLKNSQAIHFHEMSKIVEFVKMIE